MKKPKHQTYGTPEHALLSLLLAIAESKKRNGSTVPDILNKQSHKETGERAYDYALRVGMEIGR
jgi:hypothetical protein